MNFLVAGGTSAAYLYSVVLVVLAIATAQVRGDRKCSTPHFFCFVANRRRCDPAVRHCILCVVRGETANASPG